MWNSWECEEWQVCGIRAIESRKIGGGHLWWWEGSSPDLDLWHKYCILNNGAPGAFSSVARPRNTSPRRGRVCPNATYSGCRSRWELSSRGFFERCQAQKHITPAGSSVPQRHLLWLSVTMRAKLQGLFRALPGPETITLAGSSMTQRPLLWLSVTMRAELREGRERAQPPSPLRTPRYTGDQWRDRGSRVSSARGMTDEDSKEDPTVLDEFRPEKMTKYVIWASVITTTLFEVPGRVRRLVPGRFRIRPRPRRSVR